MSFECRPVKPGELIITIINSKCPWLSDLISFRCLGTPLLMLCWRKAHWPFLTAPKQWSCTALTGSSVRYSSSRWFISRHYKNKGSSSDIPCVALLKAPIYVPPTPTTSQFMTKRLALGQPSPFHEGRTVGDTPYGIPENIVIKGRTSPLSNWREELHTLCCSEE